MKIKVGLKGIDCPFFVKSLYIFLIFTFDYFVKKGQSIPFSPTFIFFFISFKKRREESK